jgi:DNA primase
MLQNENLKNNLNKEESAAKKPKSFTVYFTVDIDGIREKHDIVGTIFGQTEAILPSELNLKNLYRYGKIGHVTTSLEHKNGITLGSIFFPRDLNKLDMSLIVAAIESIERIGVSKAKIVFDQIKNNLEDKIKKVQERANEIFEKLQGDAESFIGVKDVINKNILKRITTEQGVYVGDGFKNSSHVVIVEGRSDLLSLGKAGVFNTFAMTNVPKDVLKELLAKKSLTLFFDGDNAGNLHKKTMISLFPDQIRFLVETPSEISIEDMPRPLLLRLLQKKKPFELIKEN